MTNAALTELLRARAMAVSFCRLHPDGDLPPAHLIADTQRVVDRLSTALAAFHVEHPLQNATA